MRPTRRRNRKPLHDRLVTRPVPEPTIPPALHYRAPRAPSDVYCCTRDTVYGCTACQCKYMLCALACQPCLCLLTCSCPYTLTSSVTPCPVHNTASCAIMLSVLILSTHCLYHIRQLVVLNTMLIPFVFNSMKCDTSNCSEGDIRLLYNELTQELLINRLTKKHINC